MNTPATDAAGFTDEARAQLALRHAFGYEYGYDAPRPGHYGVDYWSQCIDDMVRGYLSALLWTQIDYDVVGDDADGTDDTKLDANYDVDDVHPDDVAEVAEMFREFVVAHPVAVALYGARLEAEVTNVWEYFGHDFLLTRDGHGAGFWDRGLGDPGDYLTGLTKTYGEHDTLYVGPSDRLTATWGR